MAVTTSRDNFSSSFLPVSKLPITLGAVISQEGLPLVPLEVNPKFLVTEWRRLEGKVRSRRDSPRKELLLGEGEAQARGGGEKTFSLFVTLELGAEEKPTEESYKKLRGRGRATREHRPSRAAHHCFAGRARWPRVKQGTTLNSPSGGALAGTSAGLRVQWRGWGRFLITSPKACGPRRET